MPIYDYQCNSCYCEFELIINVDEGVMCPSCRSLASRIVSVPAKPIVKGYNEKNGYGKKEE